MATILIRGTIPEKRTYTCRCRRCDSKIQFDADEGQVTHDQRDGDFLTFKCPLCAAAITHAK